MNDELVRKAPRVLPMGFKVNEEEKSAIVRFVDEREWKMSAFLRKAVFEAMSRLDDDSEK